MDRKRDALSDTDAPIRVVFVLLANSLVLDWAGPAEALRIANQLLVAAGKPARFAIEFASSRRQSVGSVGVTLSGLAHSIDRKSVV